MRPPRRFTASSSPTSEAAAPMLKPASPMPAHVGTHTTWPANQAACPGQCALCFERCSRLHVCHACSICCILCYGQGRRAKINSLAGWLAGWLVGGASSYRKGRNTRRPYPQPYSPKVDPRQPNACPPLRRCIPMPTFLPAFRAMGTCLS